MDVFLNPLVIQLKKLELGINIEIEKQLIDAKFFCVAAVMDKPAKALFINMISSRFLWMHQMFTTWTYHHTGMLY
jgi:hypothetical protein